MHRRSAPHINSAGTSGAGSLLYWLRGSDAACIIHTHHTITARRSPPPRAAAGMEAAMNPDRIGSWVPGRVGRDRRDAACVAERNDGHHEESERT